MDKIMRRHLLKTISQSPTVQEDEFCDKMTEICYQALLHQGLTKPFHEVELGLWQDIKNAYHNRFKTAVA